MSSKEARADWTNADEFLAGKILDLYAQIRQLQWLVFALGISLILHVALEGIWPR